MQTVLVLVGGFLGAGKTTLMLAAAEKLCAAGKKVGVLLNDQGEELVDTHYAEARGLMAGQIAGGCFCCRFSEFLAAAEKLRAASAPDVVFAEPVGSCTDLAATVAQPLKQFYGDRFRVAPLTVVVDPARVEAMQARESDVAYLFGRQLAEADLVVVSKADLYPKAALPGGVRALRVSAQTGEGIEEWLAEVLEGEFLPRALQFEIDYERYGAAEAALGWVNWKVILRAPRPLTPASIAGPLLETLAASVPNIAHLKVFVRSREGYVKASVCSGGEEPAIDGILYTPPSLDHEIVLNLRAEAPPELLDSMVEKAMAGIAGKQTVRLRQAFRPSPPRPEMRPGR